jgi:vacuolar-type H+-ATPase subunit F/Vma7
VSKRCVFIGDEVSAAGFRLAGLDCPATVEADIPTLFRRARERAGLVLITAELAGQLSAEVLAAALREQRPPTVVIGDIRGQVPPPDRVAALKRQLGLAE